MNGWTELPNLLWPRTDPDWAAEQIRTGQEAGAVGMTGAEIEVSPWQMGEELSQKLGSTSKAPSVRNVSETTKEGFSGGKGPSPGKKRLSRWDSLTLQE